MCSRIWSTTLGYSAILASGAHAHHSFAPHFDAEKPVLITGTVSEYEVADPVCLTTT